MQVKTMNEDKVLVVRERLSALADGELDGGELARLMAVPTLGEDAQATWQAYQLIGDVLRSGEQAASLGSSGFLSRLQTRLESEEPLLPVQPVRLPPQVAAPAVVHTTTDSANDASFRWKMVAGCASLAAVATIAWSVVGGGGATVAQPQLAIASPAVQGSVAPAVDADLQTVEQPITLANGEAQVMIRDARLDELLTAHKLVGGGTALQMPAGFLRSATFAAPER